MLLAVNPMKLAVESGAALVLIMRPAIADVFDFETSKTWPEITKLSFDEPIWQNTISSDRPIRLPPTPLNEGVNEAVKSFVDK